MRIFYEAGRMPDPAREVYIPQKVKLKCILPVSRKPVYVFFQVLSRMWKIRIMKLLGEFYGMKSMDMEAPSDEAREGFPFKVYRQGPPAIMRHDCFFRVVKFKTQLFLEQSVEPCA